ncbi:hypothetical protein [Niveispirillum sp. KHB5.9]|uniref:hypothetical protein n=1 Tax=Niveispirillum sp. KHB5.9 TaxID=3400269 RepID=UPI003A8693B0
MAIRSDQELEMAVREYQKLRNAPEGSDSAARRDNLNADIQTYYHQNHQDLRPAKPCEQPLPNSRHVPAPPYTPADPTGARRRPKPVKPH